MVGHGHVSQVLGDPAQDVECASQFGRSDVGNCGLIEAAHDLGCVAEQNQPEGGELGGKGTTSLGCGRASDQLPMFGAADDPRASSGG